MNIDALKALTPEKVKEAETAFEDHHLWDRFVWDNADLILASLQSALAYKRELEQTQSS